DAGDALVGEVVDLAERLAHRGHGLEAIRGLSHLRRLEATLTARSILCPTPEPVLDSYIQRRPRAQAHVAPGTPPSLCSIPTSSVDPAHRLGPGGSGVDRVGT